MTKEDILTGALAGMPLHTLIEAQEVDGQRSLCRSSRLPADMDAETRRCLEAMGIRLLGPREGDLLFLEVELPEGWTVEAASDGQAWACLADPAGNHRAVIDYEAETVRARCRYGISSEDCGEPDEIGVCECVYVTSSLRHKVDVILWETGSHLDAEAYLDEHYPNWRDPMAYWPAAGEVG